LELPEAGSYATGILFLDKDNGRREKSQKLFETAAADLGLKVLAWREIPKNPNCLGQMAQNSEPYLTQVLFTFLQGRFSLLNLQFNQNMTFSCQKEF
jgi:glutamate synthase (NADPH/NADH) large chain